MELKEYRCTSCGASLNIADEMQYGICPYCGTSFRIVENDKRADFHACKVNERIQPSQNCIQPRSDTRNNENTQTKSFADELKAVVPVDKEAMAKKEKEARRKRDTELISNTIKRVMLELKKNGAIEESLVQGVFYEFKSTGYGDPYFSFMPITKDNLLIEAKRKETTFFNRNCENGIPIVYSKEIDLFSYRYCNSDGFGTLGKYFSPEDICSILVDIGFNNVHFQEVSLHYYYEDLLSLRWRWKKNQMTVYFYSFEY